MFIYCLGSNLTIATLWAGDLGYVSYPFYASVSYPVKASWVVTSVNWVDRSKALGIVSGI